MKLSYGFTNDGNAPTEEKTRLVIEIEAKYSTALLILDAARLEFEDIQAEERRQSMDHLFAKFKK